METRKVKLSDLSDILDGDRGKNYPKQDDFSDEGYCLFLTTKRMSKKSSMVSSGCSLSWDFWASLT